MRLDPLLDSFYTLGSLWGALTGPQFCSSESQWRPRIVNEAARSPIVPAEVTAFIDVNVVPMDSERVLPNHTVLVKDGRITALGPVAAVHVPAAAVRIDGRGKYLLPGLADMHAHLHMYLKDDAGAKRHLLSYLANGVTTVRHLDGGGSKEFMRFRAIGPRLLLAPSTRGVRSMRLDSVAAAVAAYKANGYDFIEIEANYIHMPAEKRAPIDSLLAAARRLGLPLSSHSNDESYEEMLAFGALGGSVEHLYAFRDTLGGPEAAVTTAEIQAVAAATKRAGTWLSVTLDCVEERKKPPVIGVSRRLVKALQDAGVGLLIGADADMMHGTSPSVVHEELRELVRAGLTPYQALVAGTRNVAQFMGLLDSSGTVAVGKRADLVLLRGNPLTNIRYTLDPAGTMVNGRWFDRVALDPLLLALPKMWFRNDVLGAIMPALSAEQSGIGEHTERVMALLDSLELTASSQARLLALFAEELGAMRAILTPDQREIFDPMARMWVREQTRQGHHVTIAGVTRTP